MVLARIKTSLSKLYVQVLIDIIAGVLLGHYAPNIGAELKPLGDIFIKLIKLIKMLLAPIILRRWWSASPGSTTPA